MLGRLDLFGILVVRPYCCTPVLYHRILRVLGILVVRRYLPLDKNSNNNKTQPLPKHYHLQFHFWALSSVLLLPFVPPLGLHAAAVLAIFEYNSGG
jgi:hypothetical protein